MEILDCKGFINEKINAIITAYQDLEKQHNQENKLFSQEVERINQLNKRFSHELFEKDKLLTCKDKTIHDYEKLINDLQDQKKEETKFDMIRGQDQEIKNLLDKLKKSEVEIVKLNEKIILLESTNNSNVEMKVEDVVLEDVVLEDVVLEDDVLEDVVEKVEDNSEEKKDDKLENDVITEKPTEVVDDDDNNDNNDDNNDNNDDNNDNNDDDDDEELDEEPLNVEVITHYKKSYYIIENEVPQYIYNIDDEEELGDKVGVIENGKKKFYNKK